MDSLSSFVSMVVNGVNNENQGKKSTSAQNQAAYRRRVKASAPLSYAKSENERSKKQMEKRKRKQEKMTDAEKDKERKVQAEKKGIPQKPKAEIF